ncbi:MAG: helix-turn-helix domain containing protein [Desulfovibrionaceae bacterium]|nr:helix-turn-helix domain containing protein [Desulfovibrionaceae bacterium]
MKRLHDVTRATDQRQLAAFFNVRQSAISDALRRNRIPLDWLLQLQHSHGISPLWVITGAGERHIRE